jgi:hypothetical protein
MVPEELREKAEKIILEVKTSFREEGRDESD